MTNPTTRFSPLLALALAFGIGGACAADSDLGLSKSEASDEQRKGDSPDLCAENDWYSDGECDSFCLLPDLDCMNACPDPSVAGVNYIATDVSFCLAAFVGCPEGQTAFNDDCGCGCVDSAAAFCGGFGDIQCDAGYECIDDPNDNCDLGNGGADCGGICIVESSPAPCGGFGDIQCDAGYECVDDPSDDCNLDNGADCGGICVPDSAADPAICGGFAGLQCADGSACVDDPSDDCDELGADCGGLCQSCPEQDDPEVHYLFDEVLSCAAATWQCEAWQVSFDNECGCGCLGSAEPLICDTIFTCPVGMECVDNPNPTCGPNESCNSICVYE